MNALPIIVAVLCVMAIAYRYYSAFIAARVLALNDSNPVPSQTMYDGHNYYPTNKWVLFGHHFAAISGAGPLIGPVLAAQFGFLPGLLWLVIGVGVGGAGPDFFSPGGFLPARGEGPGRNNNGAKGWNPPPNTPKPERTPPETPHPPNPLASP